ncbi:GNAT family N-acetyltransferase [Kangiella shandongensis]|uniref:GNAT family N-acetyltransferase n=1 Tax=Kangiella shandongensis TaxID=2763258 RepID=UPI001CC11897|nr:GNAT family N-acetyltransferase [Kangiella shandongensis]
MNYSILSWAELSKEQLYQLLRLRSEVFVVEQECAYQDLDGLDEQAQHILVIGTDNQLNGYTRIYEALYQGKTYQAIGRVCVKASQRGQGVARQMMQVTLDHIESKSQEAVTVSAQAYLEAFYQQLGFNTVSEPYLEDGIPHIRMIRERH